jgi:hypothetical protein
MLDGLTIRFLDSMLACFHAMAFSTHILRTYSLVLGEHRFRSISREFCIIGYHQLHLWSNLAIFPRCLKLFLQRLAPVCRWWYNIGLFDWHISKCRIRNLQDSVLSHTTHVSLASAHKSSLPTVHLPSHFVARMVLLHMV